VNKPRRSASNVPSALVNQQQIRIPFFSKLNGLPFACIEQRKRWIGCQAVSLDFNPLWKAL
jgi:hypothetical protein